MKIIRLKKIANGAARGVAQSLVGLFIVVAALTATTAAQKKTQPSEPVNIDEYPRLESGKTVEREISGGSAVFFSVKLRRGEVLRLDGEEFANDYMLIAAAPTLRLLAVSDFGVRFDRETVFYVAENADEDVLVLIKADKEQKETSKFRLTATIRRAEDADRRRVEAAKIQVRAYKALNDGTTESLAAARADFESAAKIWRAVDENYWAAYSLNYAGMALVRLGKNAEALPLLEAALPLWRAANAKNGEADSSGVLGLLYFQTGESRRAIESFKRATELARGAGDRASEANHLESLSRIFSRLGEREKMAAYVFAASVRPNLDDRGVANMLSEMSVLQQSFGNFPSALEFDKLALEYARDDKYQTAGILAHLTDVYIALERFSEASEIAEAQLKTNREIENGGGDAIFWEQLAQISLKTGDKTKAREAAEKSLALAVKIDDRTTRASIFNTAGAVYNASNEAEKALPLLKTALVESKAAGVTLLEADAFKNLMLAERALKNARLAVFFGKQAVNVLQNQRSMLKSFDARKDVNFGSLDRSGQKSFLKSSENSYKKLAEVLIENNRLAEAHEVLTALKDQQMLDFDADVKTRLAPLSATAREAAGGEKFALAGARVDEPRWKLHGYNLGEINEENKAEVAQIEKQLNDAAGEYANALNQIETDFAAPVSEKDRAPDAITLRDLQTTLRESNGRTKQKSAAIYEIVGDENFTALVVTADNITKTVTAANGKKLEEKALRFWALLQSPTYDPTKISGEIYDIVFKPIETKIPADTKTLLWIADGNLRYVPPAALFDGEKYLVERFNHVAFTRRTIDGGKQANGASNAAARWTGTGFGSAAAHTVELNGERISFAALTGVADELNKIFSAKDKVLTGAVFADARFTKANFLAALKLKRPVVHVASHFNFSAGDESNSFLLMGDGSALTLAEMKSQPKLFAGVELLTLSACNTAAQRTGANGREIDGFAELAQRLGANSVMATLWSVADASTPALMRDFYSLKLNKNLSKAEALRQAQIALLSGASDAVPSATRGDLSPIKIVLTDAPKVAENTRSTIVYLKKQDAPVWDKSKHAPFAHPFFWSPFVLFGNWQ